MSTLRYRSGDAEINVDDTLGDLLREVLDSHLSFVSEPLNRHLDKIEKRIEEDWPVKTGASKDGFVRGMRVERRRVIAFLENRVGHTFFVKGRPQNGRRSWRVVVVLEAIKREDDLVDDLGDALLELHGVGR